MSLSTRILIGLIAGILVGLIGGTGILPFTKVWIAPLGTLFINMIKMIIVPVVLSSLVVGVASLGDIKKLGRVGLKTVSFFLMTTACAVVIGLVLGVIMNPGKGLSIPLSTAAVTAKTAPPLSTVLVNLVPSNPIQALANADMLQIIVFALFLGVGITMVGLKAKPVENFFEGLAEISYKIVGLIMEFAPIGVFALIIPVVSANGPKVLLPLASVIIAMYIGGLIHMGITYGLSLSILGRMNPSRFFKAIFPAMLVAFSTCSSAAALPVNMKCTQDNLNVSKDVSSFVLPLGATVNMDGTAIYEGICALFVAQAYGIDLTFGQMATVVVTGTLASIGAAGVPGAGLIMLTLVLQSINLPLEGIALVAGIDRILDMMRTTVNITGDAVTCVVVQHSEDQYKVRYGESING